MTENHTHVEAGQMKSYVCVFSNFIFTVTLVDTAENTEMWKARELWKTSYHERLQQKVVVHAFCQMIFS